MKNKPVRLAALILPPRLHLIRFHGVFAPNHHQRTRIVPRQRCPATEDEAQAPIPPAPPMTWAQL